MSKKKLANITVIPEATGYHIKETKEGTKIIITDTSEDVITILLPNYFKDEGVLTCPLEGYDELGY